MNLAAASVAHVYGSWLMPDLDWRDVCIGLAVIGACLLLFCQYMTGELGEDEEQYSGTDYQEGWR